MALARPLSSACDIWDITIYVQWNLYNRVMLMWQPTPYKGHLMDPTQYTDLHNIAAIRLGPRVTTLKPSRAHGLSYV